MDIVALRDNLLQGGTGLTSDFKPYEQLHNEVKELEALSIRDGLTGVYNRRYLDEQLQKMTSPDFRDQNFTIMMMDVDKFKNFNDTNGHEAGDKVLQRVCQAISANIREDDILCRYGGEEFVIIYQGTHGAAERAEQIRKAVEDSHVFANEKRSFHFSESLQISISIGIAGHRVGDGLKADEVLRNADQALYKAKQNGRNRFEMA
jgi:diguanylate cyclase (GGDEF)-like protein